MNEHENKNQEKTQESKPEKEAKSTSKKHWVKKLLSVFGSFLGVVIVGALILYYFPTSATHEFSIKTTAKEIHFETESMVPAKSFRLTIQPHLNTLSVSAKNLNISTSAFVIQNTNEPKLKRGTKSQVLKVKSKELTYYSIKNFESITIPIIIDSQPNKNESKIRLEFTGGDENILTLHLPTGKTTLDLKTKEVALIVNEPQKSEIKYGDKPLPINGRPIQIRGKPHKIEIEIQNSEQARVELYTEKQKEYNLTFNPNPPMPISPKSTSTIRVLQASPETTIERYPRKSILIKEGFAPNPEIIITGIIEQIIELKITNQGIFTSIRGEYKTLKIGNAKPIKNTLLDEFLDWAFLSRWKQVKEIFPFL